MTDLAGLLRRVEASEGPDRELFEKVAGTLLPHNWWVEDNRIYRAIQAEAYIDAAVALVERVLPEAWVEASFGKISGSARVCFDGNRAYWAGTEKSAPMAILAALLKALIAQRGEG